MTTKYLDLPFFTARPSPWQAVYEAINHDFLPEVGAMFNALCTPGTTAGTKVVIIGQDPYPTPGHANGFAFSVNSDVRPLPKSLQNIYRELESDLDIAAPPDGDLRRWATQGVLLINSCLTVRPFQPGSHRGLGWEKLIVEVIEVLNREQEHRVYILWGRHAQSYESIIDAEKNLIIKSPHPSPLAAYEGFFGSRPFSRANQYLVANGIGPINWGIDGPENARPNGQNSRSHEEGVQH